MDYPLVLAVFGKLHWMIVLLTILAITVAKLDSIFFVRLNLILFGPLMRFLGLITSSLFVLLV